MVRFLFTLLWYTIVHHLARLDYPQKTACFRRWHSYYFNCLATSGAVGIDGPAPGRWTAMEAAMLA